MDEFTGPSNPGNFHSGYGSYPNSPDSSTLGTVTKQITVPHILYKASSMKGKGIQTISFFERILLSYREFKSN